MTLRPRLRPATTSAAFAILRHQLDAVSSESVGKAGVENGIRISTRPV
jgi:hypothetical protein